MPSWGRATAEKLRLTVRQPVRFRKATSSSLSLMEFWTSKLQKPLNPRWFSPTRKTIHCDSFEANTQQMAFDDSAARARGRAYFLLLQPVYARANRYD